MNQEAKTQRPRIVLQVRSGTPNRVALESAFQIARAMHSQIDSLFIENEDLIAMAELPCAREVTLVSGKRGAISPEIMAREMRIVSTAVRRRIEHLARVQQVPFRFNVIREHPAQAVFDEASPGCVVAMTEPYTLRNAKEFVEFANSYPDVAGFMLVGPHVRTATGSIVLTVERPTDLELLTTAERLRSNANSDLTILVIGEDQPKIRETGLAVREMIPPTAHLRITLSRAAYGEAAVVAEAIRKLSGGLTVARMDGMLTPGQGALRRLLGALECPLLLLR